MDGEDKREKGRLEEEDFRKHPTWSRQMFAYRMLMMIARPAISRRLNKLFRKAQLFPGVSIPDDVDLPPGVVVPPGTTFPPGWSPGDPAPNGVIVPPGTTFPPGWTPGDPAPPGVIIPPGTIFPPGWSPGDPLPGGTVPPPTIVLTPDTPSPAPPGHVAPWGPGPPNPPPPAPPAGGEWGEYTTDAFWQQIFWHFAWSGTAWVKEAGWGPADIKVNTGSTWAAGFRPSKMRLTYSGPTSLFTLTGGFGHRLIGPDQQLSSGEIVDLNTSYDEDVKYLNIDETLAAVSITKIEFFG